MAVARLCIAAYSCAGRVVLTGFMTSASFASHGIVAGCSFATALIQVNGVEALDRVEWPVCIAYALYIDDNAVRTVRSESDIVAGLSPARSQLVVAISDSIGATLADD